MCSQSPCVQSPHGTATGGGGGAWEGCGQWEGEETLSPKFEFQLCDLR